MSLLSAKRLSHTAEVDQVLRVALCDNWMPHIDRYMKREAQKLKPNLLYRVASRLPSYGYEPEELSDILTANCLGTGLISACAAFIALLTSVLLLATGAPALYTIVAGLIFVISITCSWYGFALPSRTERYRIIGPGYWKTSELTPGQEARIPAEVHQCVQILRSMMVRPKFAISFLFQDEQIFDPVIWLTEVDRQKVNIPIKVYDEFGRIVSPPA